MSDLPRTTEDLAIERAYIRTAILNPRPLSEIAEITTERIWFWDNILTTGLAIIAGKKACLKSFLSLHLCPSIANGVPFLGKTTRKARVLYLALELDAIAIAERVRTTGIHTNDIDVFFSLQRDSALEDLKALILARGYGFIVVDMLPAILPQGTDGNAYDAVTDFMLSLRRLAQENQVCILCLLHAGKAIRDDFVDSVLGSTGFAGQADTVIVLNRKRGDNTLMLSASGNHGRDCSIRISVGENLSMTRMEDEAEDTSPSTALQARVLNILREKYPDGASARELSGHLAQTPDAIRKMMNRMDGTIEKPTRGKYRAIPCGSSKDSGQMDISGY